jgi:hypothetical protein
METTVSPDKDEVMIQVMLKKDVYDLYRRHMMGQHRDLVGLERFYDIWNETSQTTIL